MDPLLGNDREISSCITTIAEYWFFKQWPLLGIGRKTATEEGCFLCNLCNLGEGAIKKESLEIVQWR
jgi:hypothetical protein